MASCSSRARPPRSARARSCRRLILDAAKTSPTSTPLLRLDAVSSGYGGAMVLENVTLEVRQGEIVALLGPNGAGKTTLLNTVSRMTHIFAGAVSYRSEDLVAKRPDQV